VPQPRFVSFAFSALAILLVADPAHAMRQRTHEAVGRELYESPQVNPIVLNEAGTRLYVANTTGNIVSVFNAATHAWLGSIEVGVDPVSLAIRPGANELWVSNHVSDSVSVIDVAPGSPTENRVVDTVQAFDADGVTTFDEPVGIAFTPTGAKAYVALSSRNQIAVIDAATRAITARLNVTAQEPRAIAVRNGLLYVVAFESHNRSETGICTTENDGNSQCTLGVIDLATFATDPNLPGEQKNIVFDTSNPDRDLFVFRTDTDALVTSVSGIGTLEYGLAVSSTGRAFVTQTDARNQVNGIVAPAGSRQDVNGDGSVNLKDLGNRMFTNEIAATTCSTSSCGTVAITDLEGASPTPATALATPYAIAISGDDSTLVVTAMGSSRVFTMNASTMAILSRIDLGAGAELGKQMPRGVALLSGPGGAPQTAYVLNSFENTVSVIDVSNPSAIAEVAQFVTQVDPTPEDVQRGRIAFHSGFASSNGTFSCASCHPDGNTDQLMWRIGAECFLGGCVAGEDEPRSTMPIRGLKNTLPLHWAGNLGDPFGNGNGDVGLGGTTPSCDLGGPDGAHDCFADLVPASLAGVMCNQTPSCATGPSGAPGQLDLQERDDLARYLAAVSYPPARSRRIDDTISTAADPANVPNGNGTPSAFSANALGGFRDFFTDQGGLAGDPDTCADSTAGCHVLPLGAGTDSSTLGAFDVPTMRGLTDRYLQFSLGLTFVRDMENQANSGLNFPPIVAQGLETPIRWSATQGPREITTFGVAFLLFQPIYNTRPLDSWQMIEEMSTGHSGAQARQVQLNVRTTGAGTIADTEALMSALELADARGLVNLRAIGTRNTGVGMLPLSLSYRPDGTYKNDPATLSLTHAQLVAEAQAGTTIVTLTASLRSKFGAADGPQPLLGNCLGSCTTDTGDPALANLAIGGGDPPAFSVEGTDVRTDAVIFVNGAPASGTIGCGAGVAGSFCVNGPVSIDLDATPAAGLHLVQVQNPAGPISNELPICVGAAANCN
jgi:YVTN family beta-propeller protein